MSDEEKVRKLDELLITSNDLPEGGNREIEKIIQEFAAVDITYLTFGRIDQLCNLFMMYESGNVERSADFVDMICRSVILVLKSFVIGRPRYAAGLRTKKGFMTSVKSRLGKIDVKNEDTVTVFRRFLTEMVALETEVMKEPKLRQEFLDVTVKIIDKLISEEEIREDSEEHPKNYGEWLCFLELFLRMCKWNEQDCTKLLIGRREEKNKKRKRKKRKYIDHYGILIEMINGSEELPDGVSATHMLTVLELMSAFKPILDETALLTVGNREALIQILVEESDNILCESLLSIFRNIARSESYQKTLLDSVDLVEYLKENLTNAPYPDDDEEQMRSLSKEILWSMREELALTQEYASIGTEMSKIDAVSKSAIGPTVLICIHKRINGDDDWQKLEGLREVLCLHGFMCHHIIDLDQRDLPDRVDLGGEKEDVIIVHKVCPFVYNCSQDGNEICYEITKDSGRFFFLSLGEEDEGEKNFEVEMDTPNFNQDVVRRCLNLRNRASALRLSHDTGSVIHDSGVAHVQKRDPFENGDEPFRLYAVVSEGIQPTILEQLTQKAWNMRRPNLVIFTNIGLETMPGTQNEIIERFRKLLLETARDADAWIVGGGVDHESTENTTKSMTRPHTDVVTMGISSINNVKDAHEVFDGDNPDIDRPRTRSSIVLSERQSTRLTRDADSLGDDIQGITEQLPLDKFYSHFIFTKSNAATELEDEVNIYQMLSHSFPSSQESVPSILIVIEGDAKTLKLMVSATRNELPILVYRGTGGVADIVALAEKEYIQTRDRQSTRDKILRDEGFLTIFKDGRHEEKEKRADDIFEIVCKRHLLSTYDFNLDNMAAVKKGLRIEDNILQSLHGTRFDILYKPSAIHIRNGDFYALKLVVDAVREDTKVVLFKNTKGVADFLIYYLQDVNVETKDALIADIDSNMTDEYFKETKYIERVPNTAAVAEAVLEILRKRHLVRVVKASPKESTDPDAYEEEESINNEDVVEKLFEVLSENKLFPIVIPIFPEMDNVTEVIEKLRIPLLHYKSVIEEADSVDHDRSTSNIPTINIEEEMFLAGNECRMMDFLLKCRTAHRPDVMSILRLSLKWNRVNKEDTEISTTAEDVLDEPISQPIKMDDELFISLSLGDVDTFRLLSSKRYSFESFFSTSRHRQLYRSIQEGCPIFELLPEKDRETTVDVLDKVEKLIRKLIRYKIDVHALGIAKKDDRNESERQYLKFLFLYAVLMNYTDLARFLWRDLKDRLPAALIAYGLLYQLSKKQNSKEARTAMLESADTFSNLAVKLLSELSKIDSNKAREYLRVYIPDWGNDSCLNIAYNTKNRTFISAKECQRVLDMKWATYLPDNQSTREVVSKSSKPDPILKKAAERGLKGFKDFIFAPRTTFFIYLIVHIIFLGVFSWFMLSVYDKYLTAQEVVVFVYVGGRIIEEVRQLFALGSLSSYLRINMNKFDLFTILIFLVGLGTRIPYAGYGVWEDGIEVTRILYGITLSSFYVRILYSCSVNRNLGPKILMIYKMIITDLSYYSLILFLPLLAYGVTAYANLLPKSTMDGYLFLNVLRFAYWPLYGELLLDEIEVEDPNCSSDPFVYNAGTLPRCPSEHGRIFVTIFLGVYVLLSNILLLNVLIAMFSNTFMRIESETDKYAHFQRCNVIYEFAQKPFLPMPLGVFIYFYRLGNYIFDKCCQPCCTPDQEKDGFVKITDDTHRWARDHTLHLVLDDDFSRGKSAGNWGVLSMSEKIDQIREELMSLQRQMNISEKHQVSKQTQDTSGFNVDTWKSEQRKVLRSELALFRQLEMRYGKKPPKNARNQSEEHRESADEKSLEEKMTTGLEQLEIKMENVRRTEEIERQQNMKRLEEMIMNLQRGTPITPVTKHRPPPPPPSAPQQPRIDDARLDRIEKALENIERYTVQGNLITSTAEANSSEVLERIMITEDRLLALENKTKRDGEGPTITPSVARLQTRTPLIERLTPTQSAPTFAESKQQAEKMNSSLQTLTEQVQLILKMMDGKTVRSHTMDTIEEEDEDVPVMAEPIKPDTPKPPMPSFAEVEENLSKYLTQIETKVSKMDRRISHLAEQEEKLQRQLLVQIQNLDRDDHEAASIREMQKHFEAFGQRLNETIKNDELLKRQLWEYQHRKEQDAKEVEGKVSRMEWAIQTLYFRLNAQPSDSIGRDDDRFPPTSSPDFPGKILQVKPAKNEDAERLQNIEDMLQDMNYRLKSADQTNEALQKDILDNLRVVRSHTEEEMQLVVRNALLKEKDQRQLGTMGQLQNTVASMDARLNQTRADIRKIRDLMTEIADVVQEVRQNQIYS